MEHERPESQTVVDKFRRLVSAGEEPQLDAGGQATVGVVHVEDVARILLGVPSEPGISVANVAAETVTVADVARLARGKRAEDQPGLDCRKPVRLPARTERLPRGRLVKLLVVGASGFLGSRVTEHLRERGHDVVAVTRPGRRERAAVAEVLPVEADAGGAEIRELIAGCAAVLHFGGVPDPEGARRDPARAVRENAGTTAQPAGGVCRARRRARLPVLGPRRGGPAARPVRDVEAPGRGGLPAAPGAARPSSASPRCSGPASSFRRARPARSRPSRGARWRASRIVIPGDPRRTRDFVYVDDFAGAVEEVLDDQRWNETLTVASGRPTPLIEAAELVKAVAGSGSAIETPGGKLAAGENESYPSGSELGFTSRPLPESVELYVDWLRRHTPCSRPRLIPTRSPSGSTAARGGGSSCALRRATWRATSASRR